MSKASFLTLPRELRDNIYEEILSTSSGIYLKTPHYSQHWTSDTPEAGHYRRGHIKTGGAILDTALLYVNRQVSAEAARALYSANVFHVPSPLSHFVQWLLRLPPQHRRAIRKLEFPQRLFMPLLFNNNEAWKQLFDVIAGRFPEIGVVPMQLTEVTISVPLDFQLYEPSPALGLRKLLTNSEQFWWPAVKFFIGLLMETSNDAPSSSTGTGESNASLARIHLIYPSFENRGIPTSQTPVFKPLTGADAVDIEILEAVRYLRIPRNQSEDEEAEDAVLDKMMKSGTRGAETKAAWKDFHDLDMIKDRDRWDFSVSWEKDAEGSRLMIVRDVRDGWRQQHLRDI